jgi:hypothetical protein
VSLNPKPVLLITFTSDNILKIYSTMLSAARLCGKEWMDKKEFERIWKKAVVP